MPTIVLDNGAHKIKAGILSDDDLPPRIIQNAVVRSKHEKTTFFGHEFEACTDYAELHYRLPFEKGLLVDWDAQKAVWDGIFSDDVLNVNTTESTLLITEPYFNLANIQETYDQFIFEEYEFESYYRCTPASLIPHGTLFSKPGLPDPECMLIVDCGFSYTHVVPLIQGTVVWDAVRRIDVGGKMLTNHLNNMISFRQFNMREETYIMNEIKEACCYVSSDFSNDLETCRVFAAPHLRKQSPILQEYIMDSTSPNGGRIRGEDDIVTDQAQVLAMHNERFTVPEVIFRPDDIEGLQQAGLAETIAVSISKLPEDIQGMFWYNIGLVGGSTQFAGFRERLFQELLPLAPYDTDVVIYESPTQVQSSSLPSGSYSQLISPSLEAYLSGMSLANTPTFQQHMTVTRAEYQESGLNATRRKWVDWKGVLRDEDVLLGGEKEN